MTRAVRRLLTLAASLAAILLVAMPARAEDPGSTDPPDDGALLGVTLAWSEDTASAYADRLGDPPAFYSWESSYPLTPQLREDLRGAFLQAASQGAGLMVVLTPSDLDAALDPELPDAVVADLTAAGAGGDVPVWLDLFPDLNAPWHEWGQRPSDVVPAYQAVAAAVHDELPNTAMVWEPAYAGGYPFADATGSPSLDAGAPEDDATDTDGDGRLTSADDPYGPYFPGKDSVDWVAASAYHWGDRYPYGDDDLPRRGELAAILAGSYGAPDDDPQRDLLTRFGSRLGLPVMLDTAALWTDTDDDSGPTETELKRRWFDQVRAALEADDGASGPVGAVVWREQRRAENGAGGKVVDWRATATPELADSFRSDVVEGADLTLGSDTPYPTDTNPVDPSAPPGTSAGTTLSRTASWGVVGGVTALVLLLAMGARTRTGRRLSYDAWAGRTGQPASRDLRIDLLRGVAICFVVVNHLFLPSLTALVSEELVGPFSGAELFVALSGVVLGGVHAARATQGRPMSASTQALWTRAGKLWLTAVVVAVLIWLIAIAPGVDGGSVTTYTDRASGAVYDLYGPVRGVEAGTSVVRDVVIALFFLDIGPGQVNILGLYVVLLLLAPAFVWLLRRRAGLPLLALSLLVWGLGRLGPTTLFPSEFEDAFPLLTWQLLFVVGMVVGWHRARLLELARTVPGRVVVGVLVLAAVAAATLSWNNPYLSNRYDVRLSLLGDDRFRDWYGAWFSRTDLAPGRVVALVCGLVAAYVLLSAYWVPIRRALAWFLVPLGQNTLYVFVLHVFVVLAVNEIGFDDTSVLVGTLVDLTALALLWVCVRTRFLFGVVPR